MIEEREADTKRLQEQLTEANKANRVPQACQNQSSQSIQASDANVATDANHAQQEELATLRQEVLHKSQLILVFLHFILGL